MLATDRLSHFRLALCSLYERERGDRRGTTTLNLLPLLTIPIPERLIILARLDGARPGEISRTLHVSPADASLSTPRMLAAWQALPDLLAQPYAFIEDGILVGDTRRFLEAHGEAIERRFIQWFFADVTVCLFGDGMPRQLLGLTLRDRLIIYLLLIEVMEWRDIQDAMRCTEHAIKAAIQRLDSVISYRKVPVGASVRVSQAASV